MEVVLLIGTCFARSAAFSLEPRGCYICLRYKKSDDNDSPHKGYINDREKKMQLLLLYQVFSFGFSCGPHANMHPEKVVFFFIMLPFIKCKWHLYLCSIHSQSQEPAVFELSSRRILQYHSPLPSLRITSHHFTLCHFMYFRKLKDAFRSDQLISNTNKEYMVHWGPLFKAQVSGPVKKKKKKVGKLLA